MDVFEDNTFEAKAKDSAFQGQGRVRGQSKGKGQNMSRYRSIL